MKTIYSETARICQYECHRHQRKIQNHVEAGFDAKFDISEQILKLDYYFDLNMGSGEPENLGYPSKRTQVVYLYHVEELMNDFDACELKQPSYSKVCLIFDGRLWRWLADQADAHYKQIIKVVKEWWDRHHVLESGVPTKERFLLWMEDPKVTLVPQSNN